MMSGSALSSWAMAKDSLVYTRHMANILNCPNEDSFVLIDCLRQKPIEDIMSVNFQVPEFLTAFGPTVDGIVIPDEPVELMTEPNQPFGQYDLLFGLSRVEVFFQFAAHEEHNGISSDRRNRLFRTLVRNLFSYHQFEILLTIINEYTDWTRPNEHPVNILDATADALSDALVTAPLVKSGDLHSKANPRTFFYVFLHQSENSAFSQRIGCIHGEELLYVFGAPLVNSLSHFPPNYTRSEMALSEAVMTYWINFAKNGDPNGLGGELVSDRFRGRFERVVWPKYDMINQKYLAIGMKPKVKSHYHAHRLSFWRHLIPKLHDGGDIEEESRYHFLPDHENPTTYDGVVRQLHGTLRGGEPTSSATVTTQGAPPSDGAQDSSDSGNVSKADNATTLMPSSITTIQTENSSIYTSSAGTKKHDISSSAGVGGTTGGRTKRTGGYSTVLGITIAIGCSLLVLNVLIFFGIYYQHSKTTEWVKLHKSLPEKLSPDGSKSSGDIKHVPPRTPPPSPEAEHDIPPYMLSPVLMPEPSHSTVMNPIGHQMPPYGLRANQSPPIVPSSAQKHSEVKLMARPPELPT